MVILGGLMPATIMLRTLGTGFGAAGSYLGQCLRLVLAPQGRGSNLSVNSLAITLSPTEAR